MENESFLSYPTKVRSRMAKFFEKKNPFKSSKYRGIVMGTDLNVMISQVMVFLLLKQSTKNGDLPFYATDLLIVLIAAAVVILSPLISWLGSMDRRKTMMKWTTVLCLGIIVFFFVPTVQLGGSENCSISTGPAQQRMSQGAVAARFGLLTIISFIVTICSIAVWNHGVAYIHENHPNINTHLGILVTVKFIVLSLAYQLVAEFTLGSQMWLQCIITIIGVFINIPQLLCVPEAEVERRQDGELGLLTSMGRVLSNRLAMTLIIAMSIFSSGIWGFFYNYSDILRTSYLYRDPDHFPYVFKRMCFWYFVIAIIVCYSLSVSKSAQAIYDRVGALRVAFTCCILTIGIIIPMGLLSCEKGNVAGLSTLVYSQPSCSSRCGCNNPSVELQPVCMLDTMTTYLSPCHAGCSGMEDFSGISVLANCTCGDNKQLAMRGACNGTMCDLMAEFKHVLSVGLCIFAVIVFQKLLNLVLETVNERDKSVALGVATSFVTFFTFICGHIAYFFIGESTCLWSVNGICQLHTQNFVKIVSMTSISLLALAAILIIIMFIIQRKKLQ